MEMQVKAAIKRKSSDEKWSKKVDKGYMADQIDVEIYETRMEERKAKQR